MKLRPVPFIGSGLESNHALGEHLSVSAYGEFDVRKSLLDSVKLGLRRLRHLTPSVILRIASSTGRFLIRSTVTTAFRSCIFHLPVKGTVPV